MQVLQEFRGPKSVGYSPLRVDEVAEYNSLNLLGVEEELFAESEDYEDAWHLLAHFELISVLNFVEVVVVDSSFGCSAPVKRDSTVDAVLKFGSGSGDCDSVVRVRVRALIDSGAVGNLISFEFCEANRITLRRKEKPITVVLANKEKCIELNQETVEMVLSLGDHAESLSFDVMPRLSFSLILGLPWLLRHNPVIDWRSGVLTFKDGYRFEEGNSVIVDCASVIKFGEVLDDSEIFESVEPIVCDVELPDCYKNFVDVFSAACADILPEHRLYDCAIDLKSGDAVPPFSPFYSLAEQDRIELKSYIDDNLKKGFIRKSNSPAGAGVFFVPKKDGSKRLCVDYRGLNEMTCRNSFLIPLIS